MQPGLYSSQYRGNHCFHLCPNDTTYQSRSSHGVLVSQPATVCWPCFVEIPSCMQGFGAVAVLNLAVMTGNVGGVRERITLLL